MPNWAYNQLTVYGDEQELNEFESKINISNEIHLTVFKPMPDVLKDTTAPWPESPEPNPNWAKLLAEGDIDQEWYDKLCENRRTEHEAGVKAFKETGYHNWYEWSMKNWGTKWPPSETYIVRNVDSLDIRFHTPWSPPVELIKAIAKKNTHLSFVLSVQEEAMQYLGAALFHDGRKVQEISFDFDDDSYLPEPFRIRYNAASESNNYEELQEVYQSLLGECISEINKLLFSLR